MLKKVSLLMLGIVALSQSALAAKSAADVLASCANATDKTPAFQVLGDLHKFYGLRVGPQVANVAVQDLSGQGFFPGQVTLTKSAPYQYVLYGYYVGKTTAERPVAPAFALYGSSAGSKLVVQENNSGIAVQTYDCDLNPILLATP